MSAQYPAKYRDCFGEEITTIENDGKTLRMVLRGIMFHGSYFHALMPFVHTDKFQLDSDGNLWNCILDCDIAVQVVADEKPIHGKLKIL